MLKLKNLATGEEHPLTAARLSIGRDATNDLVLDDPSVSGFHANLFVEEGQVSLIDLGSTNGCTLAGQPLRGKQGVTPWQRLSIGDVAFELIDSDKRAPTRVMPAVPEQAATPGAAAGASSSAGAVGQAEAASAAAPVLGLLRSTVPGNHPAEFALRANASVGRAAGSDLRLDSDLISSRHAGFEVVDGEIELVDSGSTNGTFVNERRITRQRLRDGDLIRFDDIAYRFERPSAAGGDGRTRVRPVAPDLAATRVAPAPAAPRMDETRVSPQANTRTQAFAAAAPGPVQDTAPQRSIPHGNPPPAHAAAADQADARDLWLLEAFVQKPNKVDYYRRGLMKMQRNGRFEFAWHWSWWGFLFGSLFLIYRRAYLAGFIGLALHVIAGWVPVFGWAFSVLGNIVFGGVSAYFVLKRFDDGKRGLSGSEEEQAQAMYRIGGYNNGAYGIAVVLVVISVLIAHNLGRF